MSSNNLSDLIRSQLSAVSPLKRETVAETVRRKNQALDAYIEEFQSRSPEILARQRAERASFIGRMGLDPNSATGIVANLGASAVSGTSRMAGHIAALPAALSQYGDMSQLSEDEIAAINRFKSQDSGVTAEDIDLITRRTRRVGNREVASNISPLERFERAMAANQTGRSINKTFDLSGQVHQGRRDELDEQLGEAFDRNSEQLSRGWENVRQGNVLSGGADMVGALARLGGSAVAAGARNPGAAAEYIAENVPQLAVGLVPRVGRAALAASNVGYGSEAYQKGIEKYAAENNGALPPESVRNRMALMAASAIAAEQVVDTRMLNLLRGGDPASKAAQEAVRKSFRQSLKRVGTATAAGTAGEALTEGYQTYAEGEASLRPATGEDIYKGAAIGGLTGGALSGGLSALGESAKPTEQQAKEKVDTKAKKEVVAAARATGDVSALTDPAKPTYAPDTAVAALFSHSQLETTTQEQKEKNLAQARAIVEQLTVAKNSYSNSIAANSEQGLTKLIAQTTELLAKAPDPVMAEAIQGQIDAYKASLAALTSTDPAVVKQREADKQAAELGLQKTERLLKQAQTTLGELDSLVLPLQEAIAAVKTPTQPGEAPEVTAKRDKAVETIMTLAMSNAARLSTEDATALAEDASNGLKPEQREFLRKFTASRIAANRAKNLELVSNDVLVGAGSNKGIETYRKEITDAFKKGDQKEVTRLMALLDNFEKDHAQKAEMAQKGLDQGNKPQVIKKDGQWAFNAGDRLVGQAKTENGAFDITSDKLPKAIQGEAQALTAFKAEMEALLGLQAKPEVAEAPAIEEGSASTVVAEESTQETPAEPQSNEATTATPAKKSLDDVNSELTAESGQDEDVDLDQDVEIEPETNTDAGEVSPKLSKLSDKSSETRPYTEQNYFALYFKQVFKKLKSGGALMRRGDFLSAWVSGKTNPLDYLNLGRELHQPETAALTHLKSSLVAWNKKLKENFTTAKASNVNYLSRDMMQHLLNDEGDVDENIKTAMSAGVYHYLMIQTSSPLNRTKEDLLAMHGMQKESFMSQEGEKRLRSVVGHQDRIISELGKLAISYLGIKDTKDTPKDLMPKLEQALGTHMLFLMERQGLIERDIIAVDLVNSFFDEDSESMQDDNEVEQETSIPVTSGVNIAEKLTTYVKLKRAKDPADPRVVDRLVPDLLALKEANHLSYDVVTKLFAPTDATRYAKTTPSKFIQKVAKRTQQAISKLQSKVLAASQKVPHKVIPEMLTLASVLGEDRILKAAGAKLEASLHHQDDWPSIEAQNQNLKRQFELMMEMLQNPDNPEKENSGFFITQEVWKNFRAGITTESLNLQTSKIHRFMFARPSWTTELKLDDSDLVEAFHIALAQAFGINIDKQSNAETRKAFNAEIAKEEWNTALEAVDLSLKGKELTTEQKDAIADLAASKEGMMTLQGMQAYVKYLGARARDEDAKEAIAQGKPGTRVESVSVTMLIGVDGKTNGPMLTNLLLGAANSVQDMYTILNRGGMYQQGEGQPTHYSEYKSKGGSRDLYEDVMAAIWDVAENYQKDDKFIAEAKANASSKEERAYANKLFTSSQWAAFTAISKELIAKGVVTSAGRNLVKTPLTAFNYGSALTKAVKGMEDAFIESLTTVVADMAAGKRTDLTAARYVASINELLVLGDPKAKLLADSDVDNLLKTSFNKAQVKALRKAFQNIMAAPVKEGMNDYFNSLIERRNALGTTTKGIYSLYAKTYEMLRAKEIVRLMDEGALPYRVSNDKSLEDPRIPIRDLTYAEEDAVKAKVAAILPTMNTEMSLADGGEGGLYLAKNENRQTKEDVYQAQVALKNGFRQATNNQTTPKQPRLNSAPIISTEVDPGASALANSVQSTDSGGMHKALAEMPEAMNVHDEAGQGVFNITATAVAINKSIYMSILNYSPTREAYNTLERQVYALAKLIENKEISNEELQGILERLVVAINVPMPKKGVTTENVITYLINGSFGNAYASDKIRLGSAATMEWMDQYPWEGGSFQVTPELRTEAQKRLDSLPTEIPADLEKAITLIQRVEAKQEKKEATKESVATRESPFGTLLKEGETARIASDPRLVLFFERNPVRSAGKIIEGLAKLYSEGTNVRSKFELTILNQLKGLIDPSIKVIYVTPNTPQADVLKLEKSARGWFAFSEDGSKAEIYILGDMFADSGVTPEVLLHELVHAAIARKIASIEAGNGTRSEIALLNELKELMEAVKNAPDGNKYPEATSSVQEFVAWGMTNPNFQKLLNSVSYKSKTKQNKLVKGMKVFVDSLLRMVYGVKEGEDFNKKSDAFTALISNVSGLLGSVEADTKTDASSDINTLAMATVNAVDDYTTVELFDALKPTDPAQVLSPGFSDKLRGYLDGIVTSLHGPLGSFADAMSKTAAGNPLSVYLKAIETGKAPFASLLSTFGLKGTAQEDFVAEQIEATVRAALNEGNTSNTQLTYRKLADLFKVTRDNLKPEDFDDGKSSAQELQDRYDLLFTPTSANGNQSDYLARFAAWGLANEKGNELLRMATERDNTARKTKAKPKSFGERLQRVFEDILSYFQERVAKTYRGQPADEKLETLVGTLVDLEMKHRTREKLRLSGELNYLERTEEKLKDAGVAAREKIEEFAGSEYFRKHTSSFVRGPAALARMVAGQRVDMFMEEVHKLSEAHKKGRNIFSSSLRDVLGHNKLMQLLLRMAKSHERQRKSIADNSAKAVLQAFINEGKDLTAGEKEAISAVFMRTGGHYLLDQFTLKEMENLLQTNGQDLDKAIEGFKTKLDKFDPSFKAYFINEANVLGKYIATNEVNGEMLKMNAHNITMMYGTDNAKKLSPEQQKEATEIVQVLVSLYGIRYAHKGQKANALKVLQTENARGGENGVEMVLKLHKEMEKESLDRLFNGHPELMIHGYVPDIYNPHTDIRIANESEGDFLKSQGYVPGKLLKSDKADPDQSPKRVYVLKDGGLIYRVSGAFSLTSLDTKGSKVHNGFLYIGNPNGLENTIDNATALSSRDTYIKNAFKPGPEKDLKKFQNFMAPVFNEQGDIVNWRYLMTSSARDHLLDRENRFEKIMGALTSSIYDKETSREQNREAVKALRDQYKAEYAKDPARYIKVGIDSEDAEMREIWALLPDNTRADVKQIWGESGMMVRADSLDILFGYRKLSAGTMFKTAMYERKANAERKAAGLPPLTTSELNQIKQIIVGTVEGLMKLYARHKLGLSDEEAEKYANRTANYVTRGERGFQELVREVKDIIVVKSVVVLVGNIVSNTWLLAMSGVPIAAIVKHHLVAMKSTTAYQADNAELMNLERLVATGLTQNKDKEIAARIVALKDAIARNPVTELIEAGLMPTIVEDIAADDDPYSYKTALTRKVEGITKRVNPIVLDAARQVYMAHDTKMYQGLSRMTQLSDFVGRYTLYQHMINKKKDALTKEEAIQKASDYFINYDIPMHRGMQYIDDMGFIPFMKYFLRIQRVIADIFANNPARVLGTIVLSNFMDLGSTVLDSSAIARFGNQPFRGGAFEYPDALGQLGTINAAGAVFR